MGRFSLRQRVATCALPRRREEGVSTGYTCASALNHLSLCVAIKQSGPILERTEIEVGVHSEVSNILLIHRHLFSPDLERDELCRGQGEKSYLFVFLFTVVLLLG